MKFIKWSIMIGVFILSACSLPAQTAQYLVVSQEDVENLGQYLAAWADMHCTIIWIDDEPILIEDGNAGGCSMVWWQHPEGTAFVERGNEMPEAIRPGAEAWNLKNVAVKAHLTEMMNQTDCDVNELLQAASQFTQETTPAKVGVHLACLGNIQFIPVERGIE
jgi:hypothetical protein